MCIRDSYNSVQMFLTGITFPDSSTMSFTYEPVYNDSTKTTGRIASVKLRTGAWIYYNYTGYGTNGVNCSDGSTAGFTKTTPDGVWTFTHSAPSGTNKLSTTTVKAPTGDVETYTFSGQYPVHRSDAFTATTICYNGNATTCTNPPSAPTLPITERDEYSYVNGVTNPSLKVFLYDSYSRLTDVKKYDFGGVRGGTNYATEETFGYGYWSGSGCSAQTETVQGIAVPITGVICRHTVLTPGVSGAVSDMVRTYYSNTADVSVESHFIGGVWRNITFNYDSLGRITSITGPNSGEGHYAEYSNCGGKLFHQSSAVVSSTVTLYPETVDNMDCTGELPLHMIDANNNGTTIRYDTPSADPFWRPTSITDAAGTTTNISYNTPNRTTTSTLVTAGSIKEFVETLDSLGRKQIVQQRQSPTATQYNSVETDYDSNGRVSRVTTPYSAGPGGTNGSIVSTTYAYDGVNRPTSITSPNGAVKSFTYNASGSARDTLITLSPAPSGEQNKSTQYEYNGLGQVTSVCELTTTSPGNSPCGQVWGGWQGFRTDYTYSGPGNLLSTVQNSRGATSQTRSFTYENSNTGRMLTATTPEAGTVTLAYDTDTVCGTFIGAVVKKSDNGGGNTCLQYDLLGRLILKTYTGLNSAVTPSKTFVYDSTTNPSINCATKNQLGRLAEVSTGSAGIYGGTDEGFCYDVVGNPTDYFQNDGNAWTHSVESYFPTGIPQTLAVGNQPTITYGLDPMARIFSASASGTGQAPLTSVTYNTAGLPTAVNFGSGDSSSYGWKNGIGPMTSATFNVGSNAITHNLTWNANGTLQQLAIVDPLNTADSQTCTYSYDDLQRLLTDNCGSIWNQTYSYDPFGNVKKTGSPGGSWTPVYDQTTNHYQSIGATYDANGRLTNDTFDNPIGWDIDGNIIAQTGVNFAYDGLDRTAGSVVGGVWTNYFYAPDGSLMGTVDNNGVIKKRFVPLPMSTAVYAGGSLQQYRRNDWQGSVRVASTPSKTLFSGTAYGAFGEPYAPKGTTNNQFAGLTSDISSGTEQVSLSRRYHPGQGRWISPDGGIPNILNPQTFNAYHYALNSPTNSTDPGGNIDESGSGESGNAYSGDEATVEIINGGDSLILYPDAVALRADGLPFDLLSGDLSGGDGPAGGASSSWGTGPTCQAGEWTNVGGGLQLSNELAYPTPSEQAGHQREAMNSLLPFAMIGMAGGGGNIFSDVRTRLDEVGRFGKFGDTVNGSHFVKELWQMGNQGGESSSVAVKALKDWRKGGVTIKQVIQNYPKLLSYFEALSTRAGQLDPEKWLIDPALNAVDAKYGAYYDSWPPDFGPID